MNVRAAAALVALGTLSAIVAVRSARAGDEGKTGETKTYALSPSFTVGEKFRVERRYRQTTLTTYGDVGGRSRGGGAGIDPLAYDASTQVDAVVTVEKVGEGGVATEWTAKFEKLRVDIPDPLQTQAYRLRQRERKQKRLVPNAHPLEGSTVKVEQDGEKKPRMYKVLKSGQDAGITNRYPEVVPIMQSLVDPDWATAKPMAVGAEWEMPADQIFRMTKVLARTPLEGTIKCRFASVEEGIANIDFETVLAQTFATATMKIDMRGRIEFDVEKRRTVGTSYKGSVDVTAKGSSLAGRGTVEGGAVFSMTDAPAEDD